jgi:hypothetical protein
MNDTKFRSKGWEIRAENKRVESWEVMKFIMEKHEDKIIIINKETKEETPVESVEAGLIAIDWENS